MIMTEDQIRAVKGKNFPKAPFSGEAEMRKWISWADEAQLVDAYDACLIHARAFSVWIRDEQDRRIGERRHQESLIVDRSARNMGWVGIVLAIVSIGISIEARLNKDSEPSPPSLIPTPSSTATLPPAVSIPVSPSPSSKVGSATPPISPTTPRE